MLHTTNCGLFTIDSLEKTADAVICYPKFCFSVCCPTETSFVVGGGEEVMYG